MKHPIVNSDTDLNVGDYVIVRNRWAEIYNISADSGIFTWRIEKAHMSLACGMNQPIDKI